MRLLRCLCPSLLDRNGYINLSLLLTLLLVNKHHFVLSRNTIRLNMMSPSFHLERERNQQHGWVCVLDQNNINQEPWLFQNHEDGIVWKVLASEYRGNISGVENKPYRGPMTVGKLNAENHLNPLPSRSMHVPRRPRVSVPSMRDEFETSFFSSRQLGFSLPILSSLPKTNSGLIYGLVRLFPFKKRPLP